METKSNNSRENDGGEFVAWPGDFINGLAECPRGPTPRLPYLLPRIHQIIIVIVTIIVITTLNTSRNYTEGIVDCAVLVPVFVFVFCYGHHATNLASTFPTDRFSTCAKTSAETSSPVGIRGGSV